MNQLVEMHIHSKKHLRKPENASTISNEITKTVSKVTPEELAELVGVNGQSMVLATMNGARLQNNMIQQQVLALDFDNTVIAKGERGQDLTYIDEKGKKKKVKVMASGKNYQSLSQTLTNQYIQDNASFLYKTLSHTEDHEKFRVVFILDKPLTSVEEVKTAYAYLTDLFPNADTAPTNPANMFYGGKEVVEVNYSNILLSESIPETLTTARKATKRTKSVEVKEIKALEVATGAPDTWELMQSGEKELVQERLNIYSTKLHSKVQVVNYLKSINMFDLLGINGNPIADIFHEEENPSAGIFKMQDADVWLYKCHSSNSPFTGDIIQVVAKLTGKSYMETVNYLIEVTGIQIVMTEQINDLLEQCSIFQNTLLSPNLKESYPAIHTRFWRYKTDINAILDIFKENIYEDSTGELRSLTWMSAENLSIRLYGNKTKYKTIERILTLMSYTNWIEKLDDSQIPKELLARIRDSQNSKKHSRRSNVFELLTLGSDFFTQLNRKCEAMEEAGFTMKGMSKEYVMHADGVAKADEVYVQEKGRGISKLSTDINKDIYQLVDFHLAEETHIVINDLMDELTVKWGSRSLVERKFKQLLPKLLKDKELNKSRLTRELREQWELPQTQSSPVVLYPVKSK